MKKILVVDDNSVCLSLAKSMLSDKYTVFAVLSGEQAIKFLEKKDTDLILLDINMPDMSGFEALKRIRENDLTKEIPIIFLTSDTNPETERKCFEMGAYDFIVKPFQKATLRSRVSRTLDLLDLQKNLEEQLLDKTKQIARLSLKSMMVIASTVDKKDPLASEHSANVAWFAVEIAKRMGWKGEDLYNLQNLALVHDIGNIAVSDSIIRKNGPLTTEEYNTLKKHTTYGRNILQDMTVIKRAAEIAETHHEHYDGTGYPKGLSGKDIPIESRIIAIADAFDSMTSDRAYRKKLSKEEILKEFKEGRGTQFDPEMTDIAMDLVTEDRIEPENLGIELDNDGGFESSRLLQKVLQEYTREVRSEAQRDALTGLWNRGYAADQLGTFLSEKRHNGAMLMIDIDNFKDINDTFGHIIGDHVIQNVAEAIKTLVRSDDIVSRIGGDEFVVFLKSNPTHAFAAAKAEEFIIYFDNNLFMPNGNKGISISIGIAIAPADGSDFNTLYNKADKALYHVKQNGRHSYHFYSEETKPLLQTPGSISIDLEYLRRFITEKDVGPGAYEVEYDSFKKIYRFLMRAQKRTKQPVLMLLLTITTEEGKVPGNDVLEEALFHLKDAVTTSIRSGDVATNYSSTQYIAILVDSTSANGYLIAERIRKLFYENIGDLKVKLTYDIDVTPAITEKDKFDEADKTDESKKQKKD